MKIGLTATQANLLANFVGNAAQAGLGILYLPIFANLLGMESYGLIGLFLTLQSLCLCLISGLQAAISRDIAYHSGQRGAGGDVWRRLPRLEALAWIGVVLAAGGFALLSPWLAAHGFRPRELSMQETIQSLCLCGFALAQQWPAALYLGVLNGLQKQVSVNALQLAGAVWRYPCTHLLLYFASASLTTFFLMQAAALLLQNVAAGIWMRRARGENGDGTREPAAPLPWRGFLRAVLELSYFTWLATVLLLADKVLLSTLLSLEDFGRYSLVATLAAGLGFLGTPILQAVYPRLAQLIASKSEAQWRALYHDACQLLGAAQIPLAMCMGVFAEEILALWLNPVERLRQEGTLLRWLAVGWCLQWMLGILGGLLTALSRMRMLLAVYLLGAIVYLPLLWGLYESFGTPGVAAGWCGINALMLLLLVPWIHQNVLADHPLAWLAQTFARPILASAAVAGGFYAFGAPAGRMELACFLLLALALSYALTLGVTPLIRSWLVGRLG